MQPIVTPITGAAAVPVTLKQPNVVAPEDKWRASVERVGTATGLVTVKVKYFGCTQRNTLKANINLAQLAEPDHMFFEGDIEDVEFSHASLNGSYNGIVAGK